MNLDTEVKIDSADREELGTRDYGATLRRRWRLVLVTTAIIFAIVCVYTWRARKIYSSTTKLVVSTQKGGSQMGNILSGVLSLEGSTTDTQREIIDSPDLIRKAYQRLTPEQQAKGFPKFEGPIEVPPSTYDIHSIKETDVITIETRTYDPEVSAAFADAIANEYLDQDLRRNSQAARQGRVYVQRERDRTYDELGTATAELAKYKKQSGLMAPSTQLDDAAYQAMTVQTELFTTEAEQASADKRLGELNGEIKRTNPQIDAQTTLAENPEFTAVRDQVVQLQLQLAQVSQGYKPGTPERQEIERQLSDAQERLHKLAKTSVQSTSTERNPVLDALMEQSALAQADRIVAATKLAVLRDQNSKLAAALQLFPEKERKYALLEQHVEVLTDSYALLSERYYDLVIEENSSMANAIIAAKAEPALGPISPNVPRNLMLGFLVALVIGSIAAIMADRFDNGMHSVPDVEEVTGLATLALIPEIEAANSPDGNLYIGQAAPINAFAESFRMLRNNLSFARVDKSVTMFAVSSASAGEGKSTVSTNLAIAMGLDGKRVLLVDVDLRKPSLHQRTRTSREVGLTNVVRGQVTLTEAVQKTEWVGVDVLVSGPLPPDPSEFLNSDRIREVLVHAREGYDFVILDSPPCIGLSDMQVVSQYADAVLIVVALDGVPKNLLMTALRMLRQVGSPLVGIVVNRVQSSGQGYYGYYYYYGYGYGYGYGSDYGQEDAGDASKKKLRFGKRKKKQASDYGNQDKKS